MSNTWKIYMLTLISFLVGTSQFVISGILDEVAASVGVSLSAAGQLITVFALATAMGTPVVMAVTAKMGRRKQLLLALAIPLLILWTIAAWTFGPTQNFNLLSLAPEAGIILRINSTFVQLGFAVGAGIGGVAVGGSSILSICWIGAAAVAAAVIVASVSFGLTRTFSKRAATE
ncbi:hypothetical protein PaeBR_16985 [Paenibacillus sp. BR2-3]